MIWLFRIGDTFSIFYSDPGLEGAITINELPPGDGILTQAHDGSFYWKPHSTQPPEPEPEKPYNPLDKIDETIKRLENELKVQQQQNLILLDVNMTIYEELLLMQERFNNA